MSVTLQDIAKAAGVSSATVSRVINNHPSIKAETRENVLNVIRKYNYVPNAVARNLSRNVTNTIGVVVPDILNPFFGNIIRGIGTVLNEMGYNILMCDTNENTSSEHSSLQMLRTQQIRGLIITPTLNQEESTGLKLLEIEQSGIPVVLVDRDISPSNFDGVFLDNVKAGMEATQALIDAGHRKIAAVLGPNNSIYSRERTLGMGYRYAMEMNGMNINPDYVYYGLYSEESGYEAMNKLLSLPDPPTAIFIGSSVQTHGCLNALLINHVKIPEDIAIIGFDEMKHLEPFGINISYIDRSVSQMGETAAKLLLDRIEDSSREEHVRSRVIMPPNLKLRGSEKFCNEKPINV